MSTFVRYEDGGWILYLRFHRLLVYVATYESRSAALAVASGIDGIPA